VKKVIYFQDRILFFLDKKGPI